MLWTTIQLTTLFFVGLLAGAEVVVRFGVRGPLARLDDETHIRFRQGLIRTLRLLVPALFVPTAILAIATLILGRGDQGIWIRYTALLAILVWAAATFFGTIPINSAVLTWRPEDPPRNWKKLVLRWERLDDIRTCAAICAFIAFLLSIAGRT